MKYLKCFKLWPKSSRGGFNRFLTLLPSYYKNSVLDTVVETYCVFMMTSSNGNIFRVTIPLCGEFTGHRWMPLTKANDAELWCFRWSCLNKRLSKQSEGWWVETPSRSLWRHCNGEGQYSVLSHVLYHTWVWNRGICMCVIVRPRSHMLIVLKKVIPDTTRYDLLKCNYLIFTNLFFCYFHSFCYDSKHLRKKIALIHTFFNHPSLLQLIFGRL